ncbi:MAG: Gfo/Idh/MocA family oxidoreductase [Gemmataceae bacterium]
MSQRNRRQFLKQSAAAGVGFFAAAGLTPSVSRSANERLSFAGIGVGGKGSSDIDNCGNLGDVVAICDIDDNPLGKKAEKFPKAKKYNDFRKMLEETGKSIDAVTVSTPDHTHAVAAMMAMKMGKHVYCQKPLTHDVYEARALREAAEKYKVCTQMGNQGTAENGLRRAVELIRGGVIGPVKEVHVWTNRPIWPQAPGITSRPKETPPVPQHVHWDEFLGPAPERPYSPAYHPFKWRGWWDFGTGALGDMGCHTANMAFMALKFEYPETVEAQCGDLNPETCPSWASVVLQFPKRGDMPPCKFFWYEGKKDGQKNLPPMELFHGEKPPGSGSLLVGSKGILYSPNDYGAAYKLLPAKNFEGFDDKSIPVSLPRNGKGDQGQKNEWVEAIKNSKPEIALSNFGYAGLLTETILLGNVAMRCGKKLEWDGPACKAKNAPEADQYIKNPYRKGWSL